MRRLSLRRAHRAKRWIAGLALATIVAGLIAGSASAAPMSPAKPTALAKPLQFKLTTADGRHVLGVKPGSTSEAGPVAVSGSAVTASEGTAPAGNYVYAHRGIEYLGAARVDAAGGFAFALKRQPGPNERIDISWHPMFTCYDPRTTLAVAVKPLWGPFPSGSFSTAAKAIRVTIANEPYKQGRGNLRVNIGPNVYYIWSSFAYTEATKTQVSYTYDMRGQTQVSYAVENSSGDDQFYIKFETDCVAPQ